MNDEVLARRCQALEKAIRIMRDKLHAANRPMLREGLRLELRDICDAVLPRGEDR